MSYDTDKIEELAKWFEGRASDMGFGIGKWQLQQAAFLRSLSTTLTDLQEKAEALEWLWNDFDPESQVAICSDPDCPVCLRKRLGKEG
jgi:hypothetical protein